MMKFNEKVLIKYANSSNSEIDKEGWLLKKSESKNEFQKRYCVLKGNLFYYLDKPNAEPLGCLILEGCRIELVEEEEDTDQQLFSFKISFSPKTYKNYIFASESQELTENWMKALSSCSINHLRYILSELQKQVEDLEQVEKNQQQLMLQEDYFSNKLTRVNPFDEEDNIIGLNGERGDFNKLDQQNRICFSRRPFVEIHTYYELQFFSERSKEKTKIVNDLILL